MNPLEIPVQNIEGKKTKLSDLAGKAYLVVNTASECGFTPQYKWLESLYKKYKDKGLVIVGFPSNDFGGQEPGSEAEIKSFCELKYKVTFPLFAKVAIKGEKPHPLYAYLQHKNPNSNSKKEVKWNFNKYLIDRTGKVVSYFPSSVEPLDPTLVEEVEKLLL